MIRGAALGALLVAAVLMQSAVLARLPLPGPVPDLVLLVVVAAAVALGANTGAVAGFGGGLLVALAPPADAPLGWAAALFAVAGYLVGTRAAGEPLAWSEVAALSAIAGASTGLADLLFAGLWGQGWPGPVEAALVVALGACYCALLSIAVAPGVGTLLSALPGRA